MSKPSEKAAKKVSRKEKKPHVKNLEEDDRFGAMFHNPDYETDEASYEYGVLHPVASSKKQPSLLEKHFEAVSNDDENSDSDASQSSDDEADNGDATRPSKKAKTLKLFEVEDERHAEAFYNRTSLAYEDRLPMGERVKATGMATLEARKMSNSVLENPGRFLLRAKSSSKYKWNQVNTMFLLPLMLRTGINP